MSYILNALRKSERERQQNNTESLESRIQNHHGSPNKISVRGVVLVVLNLLLLSYFIWSEIKQEDVLDKNNRVTPKQELQIKPVLVLDVEDKKIRSVAQEPSKRLAVLSIAEQLERKKIVSPPVLKNPEIKMMRNNPIAAVSSAIKPKKMAIIKAEVIKQSNDIPFLSELDYDFRRTVPAIDINVYVYAENKQERFIMIAMRKYLIGQKIAPEMTLKDIGIDSFVLEYKKQIFQIKR